MQHAIAIHYQPKRQRLLIVPDDFVLTNDYFCSSTAVLGFIGAVDVPFNIGGSGDEGDIVEIDDLDNRSASLQRLGRWVLR